MYAVKCIAILHIHFTECHCLLLQLCWCVWDQVCFTTTYISCKQDIEWFFVRWSTDYLVQVLIYFNAGGLFGKLSSVSVWWKVRFNILYLAVLIFILVTILIAQNEKWSKRGHIFLFFFFNWPNKSLTYWKWALELYTVL